MRSTLTSSFQYPRTATDFGHEISNKSCQNFTICIMGSLIFKGTARGLYSEDHANKDFPLIFHMEYSVYSIGTVLIFLTGAMIQVT